MFTRKTKKVIHVYCEGDSEKNYFEALKGNPLISKNYVLKPNSKENDLANAIKKSEKLEGINVDNTIIIDDFSDVIDVQTENSIRIKEFNILDENSENDNELLENIIREITQKFK